MLFVLDIEMENVIFRSLIIIIINNQSNFADSPAFPRGI